MTELLVALVVVSADLIHKSHVQTWTDILSLFRHMAAMLYVDPDVTLLHSGY